MCAVQTAVCTMSLRCVCVHMRSDPESNTHLDAHTQRLIREITWALHHRVPANNLPTPADAE